MGRWSPGYVAAHLGVLRIALREPRQRGLQGLPGLSRELPGLCSVHFVWQGETLARLGDTSCRYAGPHPPPYKVTNFYENADHTILLRPILGLDMGIEMFKEILNFPLRRFVLLTSVSFMR